MIAAFERHLGAFTIAFFGVVLTLLVIAVSAVPFCTYDGPSERGSIFDPSQRTTRPQMTQMDAD
jgi:hypothetical protein